jgi:hypothetical protein
MSDISITFPWYSWPLILAVVAWPGLVIGLLLGALAWARHRVWGAILGASAGCLLWAGLRYLAA